MAPKTVREIMEGMPAAFRPDRARGVNATIQFHITGEGGGNWYMTVRNGACQVAEGVYPSPQATLTTAARDYLDLANGKLSGAKAMLTGRVKPSGDLGLLRRMESWFER
jgi:putative sterol carrier protein